MKIAFRPATPGDSVNLSAIARAAKASWGYPAAWLSVWDPSLRISGAYIERETVWVAILEDEAVAFYALERRVAGWALEHFWVAPQVHGRGIGRRLFEHVLQQVRALGPGVLVIEADPHAAGFYSHMGAIKVGSVAAPLQDDPSRRLPIFEVEV